MWRPDNNFELPSEAEIIARLEKGDLTEEEMMLLILMMKERGLSGFITTVSSEEEAEAAQEYIDYHQKVPTQNAPDAEVAQAKIDLLDSQSNIEKQKLAIVTLAHVGRVDVLEILKEYAPRAEGELKYWINMALEECETFLKSGILDRPQISFNRLSKIGRNEPCTCGSGKKFKKCCGGF